MLAKHSYPGVLVGVLLALAFGALLLAGSAVSHAMPAESPASASSPARAEQPALKNPLAVQAAPLVADAFAFLSPCNIAVTQGTTFTLDLLINGGTNIIAGQQSYLTFTNSLLQVVDPNTGNPVTTVQPDLSSFEVVLQNQVDNSNGLISYASSTFGAGATGTFRVARITFRAQATGVAQLNWQFSPPAPSNRNSRIIDVNSVDVTNRSAYQNCTINVTGPAPTSTATPPPLGGAFALLNPCNIAVTQGTTFTLDLMINGGSNQVVGQQSYLTFDATRLQVVSPNGGCGSPATTVQPDLSTFEVVLQNVVNNGTGQIGYASTTFGSPAIGQFRVARITFCAQASGPANIAWEFTSPRESKIIDPGSNNVANRALYQNCTILVTGPTATPTAVPPTLTRTAVPPTRTATAVPPTLTRTAVPPTRTATAVPPTLTRTAVPPTRTATAVPPTLTRTAVPPTRTATAVPPTRTRTPVPPTSTPTPITSVCPSVSPTRIATPAFTPRPGCSASPPSGVLEAVIIDHPTTTEARFTNHSTTCSYPIGLAVYKRFDGRINNQELYDYRLAVIPPNSTLTLTVNNPPCRYQGDAFYGPLIESFAGGVRYGERRLDDTNGVNRERCIRCNPGPR